VANSLDLQLYGIDTPLLALKNASLVCKGWHDLTAPLLFRHIIIEVMYQPTGIGNAQMDFLLSNERVRSYIRELSVDRYTTHPVLEAWAPKMERLIRQLPNLEQIRYLRSLKHLPMVC
jgi:hypothetical protein